MHIARIVPFLLLVLGAGCGAERPPEEVAESGYRGLVLDPPLPKPDFTLEDTDGRPFDFRAETEGKLTLVFVGYTNCPDVCPVQMANLAAVFGSRRELDEEARVVFVTADPRRDTADRMRRWLDAFNPRFVGLRGDPDTVHRIEDALAMPRSIVPDTAAEAYEVGHSALVVAFSPDGLAHVVYPFGTRQSDYDHDLPRLLRDPWEAP